MTTRVPPPPPVKVSDTLGPRQALVRRLSPEVPTIKELIKHAERFGSDHVVQTAVELGYNFDTCVRLMDACDRADMATYRKLHPHAPVPKVGPSEDRVKALMGITDEDEDLAS